ncbi:MAG TPA: hypothetical protein VFF65_05065, partial [Phycisphaerales bacterium]|nr:hypothetical protein [Phycisphaerales bacterium]
MTSRSALLSGPTLLAAVLASLAGGVASAQQYTATLFTDPVSFEVFVHGAGGGRQVGSALSETGAGGARATLWMGIGSTPVDLHPAGRDGSTAYGCGGQQQVGVAYLEADTQAILWTGTAASAVVLNPPDFTFAAAYRTDGVTQVGAGRGPGTGRGPHALSWAGTAESVVDLHPDGYTSSLAFDVEGTLIVGVAVDSFDFRNAGYWTARNAATWVPLHPEFGFDETSADAVGGGQIGGSGSGELTAGATHALLWTDNGGTLTDLHPAGATASFVLAVRSGVQGGSIITEADGSEHA